MKYDDMPVGTVLRNPDDGMTYVRTNGRADRDRWIAVSPDCWTEYTVAINMPPFLVELVVKPAPYVDGEGCRWVPPTEPVYRIHPDHGLSDWLTRAEIEADFGQTEEATE